MYSNPPLHGARIVDTVLSDAQLKDLWFKEVKGMADRIISMREAFVKGLKERGNPHDWSHVTNQIGMFAFTGVNKQMCE